MGSYTRTDGETLDFVLGDTYTRPTGTTLDFVLLDAIKQTLTESFSLDETFNSSSTFKRSESESFTLNDADIRQTEKVLTEVAAVNEVLTKETRRSFQETAALNDVYSRDADYFRAYNEGVSIETLENILTAVDVFETLTFNDADIKQTEKFLTEKFSSNDNYSRVADYFRALAEVLGLDDSVNVVFQAIGLDLTESLNLDETLVKTVQKFETEKVGLNDVYSRTADLFRAYNEAFNLDDTKSLLVQKLFNEDLTVNTFADITTLVEVVENLDLNEVRTSKVVKQLNETLDVNAVFGDIKILIVRDADFSLNEADIRQAEKLLTENFGSNDVYSRKADFFREVSEDFQIADTVVKTFGKGLNEVISADDVLVSKDVFKQFNEDLEVAEVRIESKDLFRTYDASISLDETFDGQVTIIEALTEDLTVGEALSKKVTIIESLEEGLNVSDTFDFFFSEGPGTPPYYVRNQYVQLNSVQNAFKTLNSININLGSQDQT